jgi:hypothetical protein
VKNAYDDHHKGLQMLVPKVPCSIKGLLKWKIYPLACVITMSNKTIPGDVRMMEFT